jgi:NADPH:quinone reductase-like Zn-dependent oxidoreductase
LKAVVQAAYGGLGVYRLAEVDPPQPKPDEVLVQVRASSVHPDVWHTMSGLPRVLRLMGSGLRRPLQAIPGTDLAGVVVSVGAAVTRFKPGDAVFGETLRGMQWRNGGAWAELATAPEEGLALKPAQVSFEAAASVPTAGLIALMNLRVQGRLKAGQDVLINGAGGGVGTLALQLAKGLGARVTAVDRADKLELLTRLGADRVLDYQVQDFTQAPERYDLIFDIPGNHGFIACRRALKPSGVWVLVGHDNYGKGMHRWLGAIPRLMGLMLRGTIDTRLPKPSFALPDKRVEMELLRDFLETGKLQPSVDRVFGLKDADEAMGYLMGGDVRGKVVIKVA